MTNRASMRRARVLLIVAALIAVEACRGILGIDDSGSTPDADGGGGNADASGASRNDSSAASSDGGTGGGGGSDADARVVDASQHQTPDATARDWVAWPLPALSPGAANYVVDTETVTDKTTGLMWQRAFSARVVYASAPDQCIKLTAGGFSDWRLPTWIELMSIVDYGQKNPAIETSAFPGVPSDWFWSSTTDVRASLPLAVFFFNGEVSPLATNASQQWRVRCVRVP